MYKVDLVQYIINSYLLHTLTLSGLTDLCNITTVIGQLRGEYSIKSGVFNLLK